MKTLNETTSTRFWELWRQHQPRLLARSVRQLGGNHADAEDALGAAMLRAAEAWPRESPHLRNPEAWLARILHNTCVDQHRARARRADDLTDDTCPEAIMDVIHAPSPEHLLLEREQARLLWRHVARLPEPLRQACVLRFERELDGRSMAVQLGLTHVNTRRRLMRACQVLRVALTASADRSTQREPAPRAPTARARLEPTTRWPSARGRPPLLAHRRSGG
ncbi:sigma-70 family RNA polymerase sigma factor [Myxococcus sp. K38C18041901]|uniref:RNA polymerase sigma factor n=1 Tax=Myxococcus guangdongensis TaxID=2906760 RepID=UPI0020A80C9D|nr:sigma-70 family RNA polymerase sigma factor [Myxococcus guangdongensis]MCP3061364.1 sigma-70 family RNA polymerase sigma factor [Myxococcus guangdongensis]